MLRDHLGLLKRQVLIQQEALMLGTGTGDGTLGSEGLKSSLGDGSPREVPHQPISTGPPNPAQFRDLKIRESAGANAKWSRHFGPLSP